MMETNKYFKPGTEGENLPSVVNVRLSGNDAPKIQYIDPVKGSIPEPVFFIGYDCYDKNNCVYTLYRRIGETTEVINLKKSRDESQFMEEFQTEVAKHFNVDIYDICATCGKLTKNDICKECSK